MVGFEEGFIYNSWMDSIIDENNTSDSSSKVFKTSEFILISQI